MIVLAVWNHLGLEVRPASSMGKAKSTSALNSIGQRGVLVRRSVQIALGEAGFTINLPNLCRENALLSHSEALKACFAYIEPLQGSKIND